MGHVIQLLEDVWDGEADGQTQWFVIRDCMLQTWSEMLGRDGRKQPDWFAAAQSSLRPLISKRNAMFSRWLRSGRAVDRQRYLSQKRCVASAVRSSKNKWLQERHSQSKLHWLRADLMWCGRIFVLSMNVRQVSNQSVVVPSRKRMEKCVLDLKKLCIDGENTLKGF